MSNVLPLVYVLCIIINFKTIKNCVCSLRYQILLYTYIDFVIIYSFKTHAFVTKTYTIRTHHTYYTNITYIYPCKIKSKECLACDPLWLHRNICGVKIYCKCVYDNNKTHKIKKYTSLMPIATQRYYYFPVCCYIYYLSRFICLYISFIHNINSPKDNHNFNTSYFYFCLYFSTYTYCKNASK